MTSIPSPPVPLSSTWPPPPIPLDVPGLSSLVVVTGGNGFLGGWIVAVLLSRGYNVRMTVRTKGETTDAIVRSVEEMGREIRKKTDGDERVGTVEVTTADISKATAAEWESILRGAKYVIHTAAPIDTSGGKLTAEQEYRIFIQPNVDSTERILQAATAVGTVKRFVYTSSTSAIIDGHKVDFKTKVFTESDFSVEDNIVGYSKGKLFAEKAAMKYIHSAANTTNMDMVSLNPTFIQGPLIHSRAAASTELVKRLLSHSMAAVPAISVNIVDVRDVALAHARALTSEVASNKRYLLSATTDKDEVVTFVEVAKFLKSRFGPYGYNVPTMRAPNWVVWGLSFFDGALAFFYDNLKNPKRMSNAAAQRDLLMTFQRWEDSVEAMAMSAIKFGICNKKT